MGHRDVKKPQRKTLVKLKKVQQILSTGKKTLRRVFYMLASGTYDSLGKLLVWARLNNKIRWDVIREEGRHLEGSQDYNSIFEFLKDVSEFYVRNKENSFKGYFEVWCEKATLRDIFYPITNKYGVGLLITRGQPSWTALFKASKRLDENSTILYFGDNDKDGRDIYKRNREFLGILGCYPKFKMVALTSEQERKFNFPFGEHHLDGMPEEELAKLLEASIRKMIRIGKFKEILALENAERNKIKRMVKANG